MSLKVSDQQLTEHLNKPYDEDERSNSIGCIRHVPTVMSSTVAIFLTLLTIDMLAHSGLRALYFMTNWGHLLVNFYYLIAVQCLFESRPIKVKLERVKLTLLQVAGSFLFLIIVFYWTVLSYGDLKRIMGYSDTEQQKKQLFITVTKHLLNPILIWIPILRLRKRFDDKNIRFVLGLGVAYGLWNFIVVVLMKKTVYPQIDWVTVASYVYLFMGVIIACLGYYISKYLAESKL